MSAATAVLAIPAPLRASLPPPKAKFGAADAAVLLALRGVLYGPGGEGLDIVASLGETLGFMDEAQQPLLASLPSTFDLLSRVLVPTLGAYADLPLDAQTAALEDWISSSIGFRRQVGQALRQLVLSHCYTNDAVYDSIGYPGPWLGRLPLPVHDLRFGEPE